MNYLPQFRFQFTEIQRDGTEIESAYLTEERVFGNPRNSPQNAPLSIDVSVISSLGSTSDTASITVHNSPMIEEFREDYDNVLQRLRGKFFRIRIWAWYQPEGQPEPIMSPIFIGDMTNTYGVQSQSLNDSSIQFTATSANWLVNTKKYKRIYDQGSYLDVVVDLFNEILGRGYGAEEVGGPKNFVISDPSGKLDAIMIEKQFSISRNPMLVLDDICSKMDMVWGIRNNIPYLLTRDEYLSIPTLGTIPYPQSIYAPQTFKTDHSSGLSSKINFGVYDLGFKHILDHELIIGRELVVNEAPQIDVDQSDGVFCRINEINYDLSNKTGHTCSVTAAYVGGDNLVVLAPRNSQEGGASSD